MENQKITNIPAREIGVVTAEIRELCGQANRMALMYAVEIGRRLVEAKSILPHGEWGTWIQNEVHFSQSTANNFMRLFEEYGDDQISLFGAVVSAKSQTIANLPYSKALQLLAIPAEERESFAKKVDAENISVKELQAAIRERDEAIKERDAAKAEAERLSLAEADAKEAWGLVEKHRAETDAANRRKAELKVEIEAANRRKAELEEEIEALKNKKPEIPDDLKKKIRDEEKASAQKSAQKEITAAKSAADKQIADLQAQIDKQNAAIRASRERMDKAIFRAEEAEKRLAEAKKASVKAVAMKNPAIAEFRGYYNTAQSVLDQMADIISRLREEEPESAGKLEAAMDALVQKYGKGGQDNGSV